MIDDIDERRNKIDNKRPRYFAGQYLLADDFQLEQDYHIDRQWRQNRLLHVSGIAEGLEVAFKNDTSLEVKEGTAFDAEGRLIVQHEKIRTLTLKDLHEDGENIPNGNYVLCIHYLGEAVDYQQGTESPESSTRWQEKPAYTLESGQCSKGVALANVTVDPKGKMKKDLDYSVRKYTGVRLPSGPRGETIDKWPTLRATESGQVELKGDLKITGTLNWGDVTEQIIKAWPGNPVGIGVQNSTLYFRSTGNFAWYNSGKHVNESLDAGAGGTTQMVIKGGDVGIGTNDPKAKLHILGGSDAELSKGGYLVIGKTDSTNMVVDDNEIMARNKNKSSDLHLQADGGWLKIHDNKEDESKFAVAESGNVGIGIRDPKARLSIQMPKNKADENVQGISITLGENSKGNPIEVLDKAGNRIFYVDNSGEVHSTTSNVRKI